MIEDITTFPIEEFPRRSISLVEFSTENRDLAKGEAAFANTPISPGQNGDEAVASFSIQSEKESESDETHARRMTMTTYDEHTSEMMAAVSDHESELETHFLQTSSSGEESSYVPESPDRCESIATEEISLDGHDDHRDPEDNDQDSTELITEDESCEGCNDQQDFEQDAGQSHESDHEHQFHADPHKDIELIEAVKKALHEHSDLTRTKIRSAENGDSQPPSNQSRKGSGDSGDTSGQDGKLPSVQPGQNYLNDQPEPITIADPEAVKPPSSDAPPLTMLIPKEGEDDGRNSPSAAPDISQTTTDNEKDETCLSDRSDASPEEKSDSKPEVHELKNTSRLSATSGEVVMKSH